MAEACASNHTSLSLVFCMFQLYPRGVTPQDSTGLGSEAQGLQPQGPGSWPDLSNFMAIGSSGGQCGGRMPVLRPGCRRLGPSPLRACRSWMLPVIVTNTQVLSELSPPIVMKSSATRSKPSRSLHALPACLPPAGSPFKPSSSAWVPRLPAHEPSAQHSHAAGAGPIPRSSAERTVRSLAAALGPLRPCAGRARAPLLCRARRPQAATALSAAPGNGTTAAREPRRRGPYGSCFPRDSLALTAGLVHQMTSAESMRVMRLQAAATAAMHAAVSEFLRLVGRGKRAAVC